MTRQEAIERKLAGALPLAHLEVVNESGGHNVPPASESHFRVVLVSAAFDGQPLVQRHRAVNKALAEVFAEGLHALAIHTYTEAEWRARHGEAPLSPPCLGGSAKAG